MLELMDVDKNTPDPEPGVAVFVRDAEGNATGWVKEGAWRYLAGHMYAALNWAPAQEVAPELLNGFLEFLSSRGVCALFDAGGSDGFMGSEDTYKALAELDRRGELHMLLRRLEPVPWRGRSAREDRRTAELANQVRQQAHQPAHHEVLPRRDDRDGDGRGTRAA